MITKIEQALVERLQKGLGRLVNTVKSYGGELDDDSLSVSRLPICLVTFGGARIEPMSTNARRHQSTANFVIILAVRSLRSNVAARQGGIDEREVGVNQLITAVRRLLDAQTLGQLVKPLKPTRVRTIFNNALFKGERLPLTRLNTKPFMMIFSHLMMGISQKPRRIKLILTMCLALIEPSYPIHYRYLNKFKDGFMTQPRRRKSRLRWKLR